MLIKCIGSVCVLPLSFRISRCHTRHFTGAFFCTGFNWQPCYTLHTLGGLSILQFFKNSLQGCKFYNTYFYNSIAIDGAPDAFGGPCLPMYWFGVCPANVISYIKMSYLSFQWTFFCTGFNWQPCYTLHTLEGFPFLQFF